MLCQRGSRVKLRVDACKRKETQVDASELGVVGPRGPVGPPGAPGSARAYAAVKPQGPALLTARTLNLTDLARVATGIYCLTLDPAAGIDLGTASVLVSVEYGNSSGTNLLAYWATSFYCPAGKLEVQTLSFSAGGDALHSNGVAFSVAIP